MFLIIYGKRQHVAWGTSLRGEEATGETATQEGSDRVLNNAREFVAVIAAGNPNFELEWELRTHLPFHIQRLLSQLDQAPNQEALFELQGLFQKEHDENRENYMRPSLRQLQLISGIK
jgi:hypothetical protein